MDAGSKNPDASHPGAEGDLRRVDETPRAATKTFTTFTAATSEKAPA